MTKRNILIIFLGVFVFIPAISYGSVASDFKINNQPDYSIPPGTKRVLILDLTLPEAPEGGQEQLKSIKVFNAGNAKQSDISKISIFEDGGSAGWDGDETEIVNRTTSPFWDTPISGSFSPSQQRIFVTVDIVSTAVSGRTIQAQLVAAIGTQAAVQFVSADSSLTGPSDQNVTGFERMILSGASRPSIPLTPLPKTPEAISFSAIRWHFLDLSNNEFGFRIKDASLKTVAESETANLAYLDETGLSPNTEYSGRRVYTYNDRGESSPSATFPAVATLAEEIAEEQPTSTEVTEGEEVEEEPGEIEEEEVEEGIGGPFSIEELRVEIIKLQQKLIELINQLIQLLQEQLVKVSNFLAGLWIQWLQPFFGE